MDINVYRLNVIAHPIKSILVYNIYCTDFITYYQIEDFLIHYVLCLGSFLAQDEEALRAYHLADSNIKLDMAIDLTNYRAKSLFLHHRASGITQEGTPLQVELRVWQTQPTMLVLCPCALWPVCLQCLFSACVFVPHQCLCLSSLPY